ncbi:MAG TPA: aminoglycoside phosphotransferase family protein [Actinomycetota bacterium]|nr:aminoglycoside phosphotransferase family protein [Actinomycetota bacterium]
MLEVPSRLKDSCRGDPLRETWLRALPDVVAELQIRWSLEPGPPYSGATAAWVAPVHRQAGPAVVKVSMPHMEAEGEIDGLRFWDGDPTVRLLEADDSLGAMLLEQCEPGSTLRERPEEEQDVVIAVLLRRMWRAPAEPHPFRPLSEMTSHWAAETGFQKDRWPDQGLVAEGLRLLEELPATAADHVLLATDLHAGNVLAAGRQPWLVIDPKPFIGDPAYDATQHLFNCRSRLEADPTGTINRFAGLLDVDAERVRLWTFARTAAEPRDDWGSESLELARALAP